MVPKRQAKKHLYKQDCVDSVFGGNNKKEGKSWRGETLKLLRYKNRIDLELSSRSFHAAEKTRTAVVPEDGTLLVGLVQLCSCTRKGRYILYLFCELYVRRRRCQGRARNKNSFHFLMQLRSDLDGRTTLGISSLG